MWLSTAGRPDKKPLGDCSLPTRGERLGVSLQGDVTTQAGGIAGAMDLSHSSRPGRRELFAGSKPHARCEGQTRYRLGGAIRRSSSKKLKTKTNLSWFAGVPCRVTRAKRLPSGLRSYDESPGRTMKRLGDQSCGLLA